METWWQVTHRERVPPDNITSSHHPPVGRHALCIQSAGLPTAQGYLLMALTGRLSMRSVPGETQRHRYDVPPLHWHTSARASAVAVEGTQDNQCQGHAMGRCMEGSAWRALHGGHAIGDCMAGIAWRFEKTNQAGQLHIHKALPWQDAPSGPEERPHQVPCHSNTLLHHEAVLQCHTQQKHTASLQGCIWRVLVHPASWQQCVCYQAGGC